MSEIITNEQRIGMLRQWLNEDRITEPGKMVDNEQILHWLMLEDKIKCKQCGIEVDADKAVEKNILRNHNWVKLKFCSGQCGGHYQMGCEG